ncbi:Protein Hook 3 [Sparganum proliferum]
MSLGLFPLDDLMIWVRRFPFVNVVSPVDLCDGVTLSTILHSLSKIYVDAPGNKQKMCVNLHHILNGIGNFFHQVLDQQLQSHQLPDVDAIAEDHNTDELFRLLQLVLCVAVNCENKEAHIQNILHMEESVQRTTMEAIQEVMSELSSSNPPEAASFGQKPLDDEELAVRCRELEAKVAALEAEKITMLTESEELQQRLRELEENACTASGDGAKEEEDPLGAGSAAARLQIRKMQDQITALRGELFHCEAENQELKIRLAETQNQLEDMKKTHENLTKEAEEKKHLKDDLDIAREELQEAKRVAASAEQWKKRAEEATSLRIRCNKLETDNAAYQQRVSELEQETRLHSNIRSQVESNRQQSEEAQSRAAELMVKVEKAEAELEKTRADLQAAIREKQSITHEFNRLRERLDSLPSATNDPSARAPSPSISVDSVVLSAEGNLHFTPTPDVPVSDATLVLSADPLCEPAVSQSVETSTARQEVRTGTPTEKPSQAPVSSEDSPDVARVIEQKNAEIYAVEQRYRGYLAKAMELIRQLDRRSTLAENSEATSAGPTDAEVSRLQSLLAEKENIIEQLERHHEQARRQRDVEERLILTAWYHLGMRMQRRGAETRLLEQEAADQESFLARQRRIHLNSTPPTAARAGFRET